MKTLQKEWSNYKMVFRSFFKKETKNKTPEINLNRIQEVPLQKGSLIGQKYEVLQVLGEGGFGIVYLVYSHTTKEVYALKTFRDIFLDDEEKINLFRRESNLWVELRRHPHIVRAIHVEETADTCRLYIAMEYIPPNDQGLKTLQDFLNYDPPDLSQSLRWAVEFCYGMEYANSKGIACHRDIKPENIMVTNEKKIKITDFGLAGFLDVSKASLKAKLNFKDGKVGLSSSFFEGGGCGTPMYMPPEQFINAAKCDQRSDIYAFGIVLYQIVTRGTFPFHASWPRDNSVKENERFFLESYRLHATASIPMLNSPLHSIINRCLEKQQDRRYQSFGELRTDLEQLFKRLTGEKIKPPDIEEPRVSELINRGYSLNNLGRFHEAIECFNEALEIDPENPFAWGNKGVSLHRLCCFEEAIQCYNKVLKINPQSFVDLNNKGNGFYDLNRFSEALECFDQALKIKPEYVNALVNKSMCLEKMSRSMDAIKCVDKALDINPWNIKAWNNKGIFLQNLGFFDEAEKCADRALEINPQYAYALNSKALIRQEKGRLGEALEFYDKAVKFNPIEQRFWYNKGTCLNLMGKFAVAMDCLNQALEMNPQDAAAWVHKGFSNYKLGLLQEALQCQNKALQINPKEALAWYHKGIVEEDVGLEPDAIASFKKYIELTSGQKDSSIQYARKRIRDLGAK